MQAIIQSSSDLNVDGTSKLFNWIVRKTYRGMNPVGYFTKNGRHFIDVSKLDEGERRFLVLSLTETMSACFDSGSKIHTWLLENAIHEAFNRAIQARSALVRHLYETKGGRTFAMFNFFGIIKLFRVSVRPPDIPVSSAAEDAGEVSEVQKPGKLAQVLGAATKKKEQKEKQQNKVQGYSMLRLFKKTRDVNASDDP